MTSPGLENLTSNLSPAAQTTTAIADLAHCKVETGGIFWGWPTGFQGSEMKVPIAIYIYWEFCKSNIYIHFFVITTLKCEHVKIIVHYDTSHFHFMHVYPVYSCLMYCWFIASEYLQLLVSIVSTYWFIHTISTYIHHLGIFPPLSTPSQCAHFEKFTLLKTNIFPPKGTIESKKSPTGPTERTPKPQYLIALATSLGVRW